MKARIELLEQENADQAVESEATFGSLLERVRITHDSMSAALLDSAKKEQDLRGQLLITARESARANIEASASSAEVTSLRHATAALEQSVAQREKTCGELATTLAKDAATRAELTHTLRLTESRITDVKTRASYLDALASINESISKKSEFAEAQQAFFEATVSFCSQLPQITEADRPAFFDAYTAHLSGLMQNLPSLERDKLSTLAVNHIQALNCPGIVQGKELVLALTWQGNDQNTSQ